MRLTVLGGSGGWPPGGGACSGYLVEHDGFRLLIDPGYAVLPRLLDVVPAEAVDAVLVSHGHPDHVADLSPLLRARAMHVDPAPRLTAYALPSALDRVLALDQAASVVDAYELRDFEAGETFLIGPFTVETVSLPHFLPNAGMRLTAAGRSLTYTGDAGPTDRLVELAHGTDLLLAEASYPVEVPPASAGNLNSAAEVGRQASRAQVSRLVLTHLWPGIDPLAFRDAATRTYDGAIVVATPGVTVDLDSSAGGARGNGVSTSG